MKKGVIFLMVFCLFLIPALSESAEVLTLCGAEKTNTLGPHGEMVYQISVPAGRHLIVEMDTTEYDSDLFIKYGSIPDQDCDTDDDCDIGRYDAAVEIENTQAGNYYVLVDSDDSGSMYYTIYAYDTSCPKREFAPCGATKNGSMASQGEDIWQIEVPAGTHLIVDMSTTEGDSDLFIKYGRVPDQDCSTDDDCDTGTYDAQVEILNTQAGFYYVLVDSDTSANMDYTINALADCSGLDVDIILNQTEFTTGDTLVVQVRIINNDSTPYNVEVKNWIKLPGDELFPYIDDIHLTFNITPDSDNTFTVFTYTFNNPVPVGEYRVEIKLVDPITVNYYTRDLDTFNFIIP